MEKRRHKRRRVNLTAERISGNMKHAVFIENLSEDGICIITTPSTTITNLEPETPVTVRLKLSSGEMLNLDCRVVWSHKTEPHGMTSSIGMEIIDPPQKYKEFVKNLS